jgi:hypothetical protein
VFRRAGCPNARHVGPADRPNRGFPAPVITPLSVAANQTHSRPGMVAFGMGFAITGTGNPVDVKIRLKVGW